MRKDLIQLKQGEKAKIVGILGKNSLCKKLDALGIREGIEIIKLSTISSKGPVIVQVGNTQIALSYNIAKKIIVEN
ncbi:MAG: FeoA family protein [Elusimicrobiota bacterium]|nr:ferrous iron transport protein A [Endomicrobiia bacterium]MCX7910727.1 ferrous iron transport protein A [Endomicrobiia bacterium]MDW8165836.1 FeoA family protein [Elusimicrobiota bacterium]